MKMKFKVFAMFMAIGLCGVLAPRVSANGLEAVTEPKEVLTEEDCAEEKIVESEDCVEEKSVEGEGLVCTVKNDDGEVVGRCWFCNCAKHAKALRPQK